jgi:hypothetical protein
MSSNAIDSQGMVLGIDTGGGTFVAIPEITDISGPGGQASEIDVTDLSSTAKEFRMGLQDEGQISLSMNWLPTDTIHKQLRTDRAAQTLRNFEMLFGDMPGGTATKWAFSAFILGIEISNAVDDVAKASVTLRLSGVVVQTDGIPAP